MKTFKYRLYPTKKQIEKLEWTLDLCRELYNAALQERKEAWKYAKKPIFCYEQIKQLPEIKSIREEYKDVYSQVLQDVLMRVDRASMGFFHRIKSGEKVGYPRYLSKNRYDSFTYTQIGFSLTHDDRLCLVKIGTIKVKMHREISGKVKTCTIKRENRQWYVTFSCEVEVQPHTPYTDEAVGVDLGLHHFAALSTGDIIDNPRYYRKSEQKLANARRSLDQKKQGSNRRKKAAQQVAKHHRKIRDQRQNFLHKQSRWLVDTYEMIVFEDLKPSKMSRRPKPKQDETTGQYLPNGACHKEGLNKSIQDAGWGYFVDMCQYKAACAGTVQVIKVNPYKTSQVCSKCGKEGVHKDLKERIHTCEHCGIVLDRDINAAINVLNVGLGRSLCKPKRVCSV